VELEIRENGRGKWTTVTTTGVCRNRGGDGVGDEARRHVRAETRRRRG